MKIKMNEIWKDIEGYEGLYQVSNLGNIKSLRSNKLMSVNDSGIGYMKTHLSKNGKQTYPYVHRLVAIAFLPNPNNLPEVNHKDENKSNNNVTNLEWCDKYYNANYGTLMKRSLETKKRNNSKGQEYACLQYDLKGNLIAEYKSESEAYRQTGVRHIADCCRGVRHRITAGGYIWRLKDKNNES